MGYVRNAWYVASWSADLPIDQPVAITILSEMIVMYRKADGHPVAFEDRCVHRFAALSLGRCEGDHLRCMYHGMLYDSSGRAVEIPGQEKIPTQARLRSYPVVELHDWIWIWMGDVAAADPALIPPAIGPSHPDWNLGTGRLDYDAEARLINDNLLDFSHLAYVHTGSFGSGAEWADAPMKVSAIDRGVRFERWMPGTKPPHYIPASEPLIDGYITYDYLLPGVLLMRSGFFRLGMAETVAFGRPDFADAIGGASWTSQAVTPLTHRTARYFFSTGPNRAHGDDALRDGMVAVARMAFAEDKQMIERQQVVIDRMPHKDVMPTIHDKGSILFNRMVDRLVKAEHSAA